MSSNDFLWGNELAPENPWQKQSKELI
jgi:hypothetical protein